MSPDLASALDARVRPVARPPGYRLAALGVALGMVLLPLVYVALVAGLAALVLGYAVVGLGVFQAGFGMATALMYLGPLVIGGMVVLFLVKPLFAPARKKSEPVSLSADAEPVLFAFVDRLAEAVGAPRPSRVDVDTRANASAGFRRGVWSMAGSDLVLTIGLPLAGDLTVRQLAGVLAHEFGHFTQGAGMRLTYLVESVSRWFERVVYERDALDVKLEDAAAGAGGWAGLVLVLGLKGVALGRWVLRGLMVVGRRLSRGLLRQMEFDADRYEVRVAGAQAFRQTSDRLALLGAAEGAAYDDLAIRIRDRRLPDDLPALVEATRAEIPDAAANEMLAQIHAARTGPLDTHPAVAERVAAAEREGGDGLALPDVPARTLFADFDALCRRATAAFYDEVLAERATMALVSTRETLAERAAETAAFAALNRMFQSVSVLPRVGPDLLDEPTPEVGLSAVRRRTVALAGPARALAARVSEAGQGRMQAEQGRALAQATVQYTAADFGLDRVNADHARERAAEHGRAQDAARAELAPFHAAQRDRLAAALGSAAALAEPPVALGEARGWLVALEALDAEHGDVDDVQVAVAQASLLVKVAFANRQDEHLVGRAIESAGAVREALKVLRARLREVAYPFQHGTERVTLGDYVVPLLPGRDQVGAAVHAGLDAGERLREVRSRCWAGLAQVVEHVEAAHGLAPLPEPAAEPTAEPTAEPLAEAAR